MSKRNNRKYKITLNSLTSFKLYHSIYLKNQPCRITIKSKSYKIIIKASLTSVIDVVNDVEVVLHRGAVRAAEAAGEQEEQRQSCGQPAARQDAEPNIRCSSGQHAVESVKALQAEGEPGQHPPLHEEDHEIMGGREACNRLPKNTRITL